MTLLAVPATPGHKGVDCVTVLDSGHCKLLAADGIQFVARYITHVTPAELFYITSAGLLFSPIAGYSRSPGWVPTTAEGQADGATAVQHAVALGLPPGVTVWLDLETWIGGDPEGWCNAAARVLQSAGFEAGLYCGYDDLPLSPLALYQLAVTRYWRSCSRVPTPATRGFCMVQSAPNTWVAGVQVDRNDVMADALGDVPTFVGA